MAPFQNFASFYNVISNEPSLNGIFVKLDEFTELLEVAPDRNGGTLVRLSCSAAREFTIFGRHNGEAVIMRRKGGEFSTTPGELTFAFRNSISELHLISVQYKEAHTHTFHDVKLPPLPDANQ